MTDHQAPIPTVQDPRSQVSGPAAGLLVTGIIGAVFEVLSLIFGFFDASLTAMMADDLPEFAETMIGTSFMTFFTVIGLIIAVVLIYAWFKMKDLQNWGLCVAASVLALFPCTSPCCLIGIPIGIWALVVLNRPEVKAAFR